MYNRLAVSVRSTVGEDVSDMQLAECRDTSSEK